MDYYIGVDAGGTKTTAIAYDSNENKFNEVKKGPGNVSVNWSMALKNIENSIHEVKKDQSKNNLKGISVGIAGLIPSKKEEITSYLEQLFSVPVEVDTDYKLAFDSTFKSGNGILLVAGTGVVLYGCSNNETAKIGGWGHLLGDEGSGYDIVIRTIKQAIEVYEEENRHVSIIEKILTKIDGSTMEDIKLYIYSHEKSDIAQFAPLIIQSAEKGDKFSVTILEDIVTVLHGKLILMKDKLKTDHKIDVSVMGGILSQKSYVLTLLLDRLKEDTRFTFIEPKEPNAAVVKLYKDTLTQQNHADTLAVGLMSGTSLDGIDAVLCRVIGQNEDTEIEVVDFQTYQYSADVLKKVEKVVSGEQLLLSNLSELNVDLGYEYAEAVKNICEKNNISASSLGYVASHGQTVYHDAEVRTNKRRSTMQIGEPSIIAYETGAKVISNFRSKDMAAHGEGAPLVPKSESILYRDGQDNILLNIGGISNLTYLPRSTEEPIFGFDTGPGNMMINEAVSHFYSIDYDNNGDIASIGKLIPSLLDELMSHWFIEKSTPKSTGRDEFGKEYTLVLIEKYKEYKQEDFIYTLTYFTAQSIVKHIKDIIKQGHQVDNLIVGGGGTHNDTLMKAIADLLADTRVKVKTQEDLGFSSDAKEAIAFVILGNQTVNQLPGNVPSVTGAKQEVILGSITYPN
ncbi:Anhydro-N-acetylmuramic acid kinase [Alkalibacterium sp. AK22]|uniref:anhydro-N-acetylmuramic acid kinase AnmK n=1 Tax=Alkalibacterium sp. AK22 TaxID=1229520 RepID=UPI000453746D|nr:anhydro-N-acetylmuramic acid kinase AnmK [Alkalibacterium sp. AK22]EXJ23133.1 Anhydro-N-acetylmuramic acid kinase [Alkalibacterium sp. AK22]